MLPPQKSGSAVEPNTKASWKRRQSFFEGGEILGTWQVELLDLRSEDRNVDSYFEQKIYLKLIAYQNLQSAARDLKKKKVLFFRKEFRGFKNLSCPAAVENILRNFSFFNASHCWWSDAIHHHQHFYAWFVPICSNILKSK